MNNNANQSKKSYWVAAALLLAVILGGLLIAAELYLRQQTAQRLEAKLEKNKALRKSSLIHQKSDDEILIYELKPNSETRQHRVSYKINPQGFRDDPFPAPTDPQTGKRAIVLGDSVAWGWGVEMKDAWPQQLETSAKSGLEVLNMAVNGYATAQEVRVYEKKGRLYPHDTVILHYVLNDVETEDGGLSRYFKDVNRFELGHQARMFWWFLRVAYRNSGKSSEADESPAATVDSRDHFILNHEVYFEAIEEAFAHLKALTVGKKVLVLVTPVFDYKAGKPYPWTSIHRRVGDLSVKMGFDFLDTQPLLAGYDSEDISFDPIHPNSLGHKIIAEAVMGKLSAISASQNESAPK